MIRHVVLVKVRTDVAPAEVSEILEALDDLRAVVPGMIAFASGDNISHEGLGRGFTHAFTCDFRDEAARDRYLEHPDHRAAGARLVAAAEGGRDGLVVVDFATP